MSKMAEHVEPRARNWLFDLNVNLDHSTFTTMVVTLWSIWYARRPAIYEGIFQSPQQTSSFLSTYINEVGQLAKPGDPVVITTVVTSAGGGNEDECGWGISS